VKHVKTTGFLDHVERMRKARKAVRDMKEQMLMDIELVTGMAFIPAQDI
jgi:hypothetical protein